MNYAYEELPVSIADEEMMIVLGIFLVVLAAILAVALVFWIFRSVGLYAIAKRRGIRHAWMAWIPIGNQWVLGSVSDQYQLLVNEKTTSRRKILLVLNLVGFVICLGYFVLSIVSGVMAALGGNGNVAEVLPLLLMVPYLLMVGLSVTNLVFTHICSFDLYRSCNPDNAVVFLVLGIILPVTEPFFYFSCRKKDLGFRRAEPAAPAAPVELPRMTTDF